jgi:PAS domain S-box-containing protein
LFGRKRERVIGRNYVDLFITESSRNKVEAGMKRLLDGEFPNRFENHIKDINGNVLKIEWSAHKLLDDLGMLIGIITIGINIKKP